MDDCGVLGEFAYFARHSIIKPRSKSQEQVALRHRVIGVDAAMHAQHVKRQWVIARESAQAHGRHRHRDGRLFDKLTKRIGRTGCDDTTPRINNGSP